MTVEVSASASAGFLRRRRRFFGAGTRTLAWNGRFQNGQLVYRGTYLFKVFAQNSFGPVDLGQTFVVRR